MIADRGAVAAALERWNERRRQIFYPKTDIDFDIEALRRRKEQLARIDLSPLNLDTEKVEFIPNAGTFHTLFRIDGQILKLAADETALGFAIESAAMSALRETNLPALNIPAFEVLSGTLPCPFLIMDEAKGKPLNHFEDPQTQAMHEPLLFELGRTLAKIHRIAGSGAGLLNAGAERWPTGLHANWTDYMMLRLDEHLKICREINAISSAEQAAIIKHFSNAVSVLQHAPIRLLHGDPGHHNIFSDGARITAIIDWEDALCGDPIFDLAYWGTFVRDEMRARLLEGYKTIEPLAGDFEQRYWLYYLRVAISKTVHRFKFGTKDRPGRPPASRRIQKALSKLAEL